MKNQVKNGNNDQYILVNKTTYIPQQIAPNILTTTATACEQLSNGPDNTYVCRNFAHSTRDMNIQLLLHKFHDKSFFPTSPYYFTKREIIYIHLMHNLYYNTA